jgi:hypothetical protein
MTYSLALSGRFLAMGSKHSDYMPNPSSPLISVAARVIVYKILVLATTVLATTAWAQPRTTLLGAVATANARKAELEQYVKELKRSVRPPDPVYAESQRRYLAARSLYNDLISQVVTALEGSRRTGALVSDASQVELRTAEFIEYVGEIVFGKRRNIADLAHFTTTLIDTACDQRHPIHVNRRIAQALLVELRWRTWADIN